MEHKTAIVTGVSSGLGLELALNLAAVGWKVLGISRTVPTDARWLALTGKGEAAHLAGDVGAPETAGRAMAEADKLGPLKLVVNCAGVGVFGPAGSFTREDVDLCLQANLIGLILFSEAAFARFRETGGTIVNVMSTASQVPRAQESLYCAAKWGARGYTESLRIEAKGTPATVMAVYPGGMKTGFWQSARGAHVDPTGFMDPACVADMIVEALKDRPGACVSDMIINRR